MVRYVASLDSEWLDYSDFQKHVRIELEQSISNFFSGKRVNPIALRGGIGQGKTQLLYHIFKHTYSESGIAIYTTLDKLLPKEHMGPDQFSKYFDNLILRETELISSKAYNKSILLTDEAKEYCKTIEISHSLRKDKIIILIDEMERSYRQLLELVHTDDRSPMAEWLERTRNLPICAFAPQSYYESLHGEAERRRWDVISIKPPPPSSLREIGGETGNLIWWLSRGRLGIAYKASDIYKRATIDGFKDFEELTNSLGQVAGVSPIDLSYLSTLLDDGVDISLIKGLYPHKIEELNGTVKPDRKSVSITELNNQLKLFLKAEKWPTDLIEFLLAYAQMTIDSISFEDRAIFPKDHLEFLEFMKLTNDIMLESETTENSIVKRILDRTQSIFQSNDWLSSFYQVFLSGMPSASSTPVVSLGFADIKNLFPMPIASPNIEDIGVENGIQIILSKIQEFFASYDTFPIASGEVRVLYFVSEQKLSDFLSSMQLHQFIDSGNGLICVLLNGSQRNINHSSISKWMVQAKRLVLDTPPRSILSDFLICYMAWNIAKKNRSSMSFALSQSLKDDSEGDANIEREIRRKFSHYSQMLSLYLETASKGVYPDRSLYVPKFSKSNIITIKNRLTRFEDIIGLAFIDSMADRRIVFRFRKVLTDSRELSSLRSGIPSLLKDSSYTAKLELSSVLETINGDYSKMLNELRPLTALLSEDEFTILCSDANGKVALKGIYRYFTLGGNITSEHLQAVNKTDEILKSIEQIKKQREALNNELRMSIKLSNSERNRTSILEIKNILEETDLSPFVKSLISVFSRVVMEDFADNILQRDLTHLSHWGGKTSQARSFIEMLESANEKNNSVFEWIGIDKGDFQEKALDLYVSALKELSNADGEVDFELVENLEWQDFNDRLSAFEDILGNIEEIGDIIELATRDATELNSKLKKEVK